MAKKNTSNKEFKPKVDNKKEMVQAIPTTDTFKIYLFKTKQEYVVTNEIGSILLKSKRAKLV
tara:strand:+ start:213 stop:398 length:186 start_codon:yes stop_codon:yes gene_type:complete